jgi:hypothetical protein
MKSEEMKKLAASTVTLHMNDLKSQLQTKMSKTDILVMKLL